MVHNTAIAYVAILAFFVFQGAVIAQQERFQNSAGIELRYSSGSKVYLFPFSPDPIQQRYTNELGGFPSFAFHYRRTVLESVQLQAAFEYLTNSSETIDHYGTATSDGFTAYGAEILGLFRLPFSSNTVALHAGGGAGVVYGTRNFSIGGVEAKSTADGIAFGIHVMIGLEVYLTEALSLTGELHFRDPQITVENAFSQSTVLANGITYYLPTEPVKTKINLNGNVYSVGAVWHF